MACAFALLAPATASASFELVSKFGESSTPAQEEQQGLGKSAPTGMAVDDSTGTVYVAKEKEVLRFSASGEFEGKLGYDVIQRGPDNSANDSRSRLVVRATGGTFSLEFGRKYEGVEQGVHSTPALPYDATATEVEAALDALPSIGGVGGSVSVSGGPGDETGSKPYEIVFEGNWGGDYLGETGLEGVPSAEGGRALTGPGHGAQTTTVARGGGLENCSVSAGDVCKEGVGSVQPGQNPGLDALGGFESVLAVAVDQSTGYLYVLTADPHNVIQVFSRSGAPIASFGESGETTAEQIEPRDQMAVDSAGRVYVRSEVFHGPARVMVFEPQSPGDYEHYRYAGASHDLFTGTFVAKYADGMAVDPQGDFFIGYETELYEYKAGNMATPASEYRLRPSDRFTIDPESGTVFYHDEPANKYRALDLATGEEVEAFPGVKGEGQVNGMAFNPNLKWKNESGRPAGLLYSLSQFGEGGAPPPFVGIFSRPPVFPPRIDSESVADVGFASVSLRASIDPFGYQTRYWFQYGSEDCATHPCAEAPLGGGELGSGQEALVGAVALSGLQPDTTYHYRVLASNQFGTVEGTDQTFTTYPKSSAGLPDGRVYELVSPAFKDGGEVFPARAKEGSFVCSLCTPGEYSVPGALQAAPEGNAVVYEGNPFTAGGGGVNYDEYLSKRTASGWQTEELSPQQESPEYGAYVAFSADLSQGLLRQEGTPLSAEAPAGIFNLYLQSTSDEGALRPLVTSEPPHDSSSFTLSFAGASADFSHVVIEANDALTPEAPYVGVGTSDIYESVDGQLRLVSVLPGGAGGDAKAVLGGGGSYGPKAIAPDYSHAVSDDGSRIFWSDESSGQVYVRVNGETTLQIPDPGRFLTASADGSRVLLSDGHVYGVEAGSITDLTAGQGGFQGIMGASEDLSRIYFVDTSNLTGEQANRQGAVARSGADNLYEYDASGSGSTVFVAAVAATDDQIGGATYGTGGDWKTSPSDRTAQVTPDGRFLAFPSTVALTGYDNTSANGGSFPEVFEYDAEDSALTCASCGLPGVRPTGASELGLVRPESAEPFPQPRNVLEDGRVLFNSRTSLSPLDVNGLAEDVYEYEPVGIGSCARQPGCIFLISGGTGNRDSEFVDASADGSDVFFTTRDQLVPADQDNLEDVYDARVNGGFAELTLPACTGTGCQGVAGAPPIFATPSSVTFAGVGNFEPVLAGPPKSKTKPKAKTVKCAKHKKHSRRRCTRPRKVKKAKSKKARRTGMSAQADGRGAHARNGGRR